MSHSVRIINVKKHLVRGKRIGSLLVVFLLFVSLITTLGACSAGASSLTGSWRYVGKPLPQSIKSLTFNSNGEGILYDDEGAHPFNYSANNGSIMLTITYEEDNVVKTIGNYSISRKELSIKWLDGSVWSFVKMNKNSAESTPDSTQENNETPEPVQPDIVGQWYNTTILNQGFIEIDFYEDGNGMVISSKEIDYSEEGMAYYESYPFDYFIDGNNIEIYVTYYTYGVVEHNSGTFIIKDDELFVSWNTDWRLNNAWHLRLKQ